MTASFSNKATLVGNVSNVPRLSLILFPPQLQNNDKVNIWGQVYILVRQVPVWFLKLGILTGCTWFGHPARRLGLERDVLCSYLLLLAWKCASNPLSCLSICADPLSMLRMLCPAPRGYRPAPPALAVELPQAQTLSVPHRLPAKPS